LAASAVQPGDEIKKLVTNASPTPGVEETEPPTVVIEIGCNSDRIMIMFRIRIRRRIRVREKML
jgi:hypothetical protein